MKPSRRERKGRPKTAPVPEEPLFCAMWICQNKTPKVRAVNTIVMVDAKTGKQVFSHRCAEHTDPRHKVLARTKEA